MSEPGSKRAAGSPLRPGRDRRYVHRARGRRDEERSAAVSGRTVTPGLGLLGQPAAELGEPMPRSSRGSASSAAWGRATCGASSGIDGLVPTWPKNGMSAVPLRAKRLRSEMGFDRSGEQVRAWLRALVEYGDRHLAEPLGERRRLLDELAEPDGAREPAGPAPTMSTLTRSARRADRSAPRRLGRRVRRSITGKRRSRPPSHEPAPPLSRTALRPSFGNDLVIYESPLGRRRRFAELEDRRVRSLSWRRSCSTPSPPCAGSPRDPAGDVELGRDRLPRLADLGGVRVPAGVDHGPVAATAPPRAFASLDCAKFSGPPRPRPPATMTSASSIEGPACSS